MEFKRINKKIFDMYEVIFPVDNKISIIIGRNGTYKTTTLKLLKEYYEEKNESVLFFDELRMLNVSKSQIESAAMYLKVFNKDITNKINFDKIIKDIEKGIVSKIIDRGQMQMVNFITNIILKDDINVLIDLPETNLDQKTKHNFIDDLLKFDNIKRLIIVTHCPEIVSSYSKHIVNINSCLEPIKN